MGVSTMFGMVFGFVGATVAARYIPEESLGVYFLLLAVVYFLEVIGNAGLQLSSAKFIASAEDDQERQSIVNTLLTIRLATIVIVVLLAIVARPWLLLLFPSDLLADLFVYVPIVFAVQISDATLTFMMQGFHLYRKMATVQVIQGALNLGLLLLFIIVFDFGVLGYIWATSISLFVSASIRFFLIPVPKRLGVDVDLLKRIIRFGLPLQVNDFLNFLIVRVDVLILGALIGPRSIAYLEVAAKIPNYFARFAHALQSVYFPHMAEMFSQGDKKQAEEMLNNTTRFTSFILLFGALLFTLFQNEVMVFVFSDAYAVSAPVLAILMLVVSIAVINEILDTAFVSAGHSSYVIFVNVTVAIIGLTGNALLIPAMGFTGAALARLLADVVGNPISIWVLRRVEIDVKVREYLRSFAIFGLCYVLYLFFGASGVLPRLLILLVYLGLSLTFSVIRMSEITALFHIFQTRLRPPVLEEQ